MPPALAPAWLGSGDPATPDDEQFQKTDHSRFYHEQK